jgi:hypothetical protein
LEANFEERAKMLLPKVKDKMGEDAKNEVNMFIYPYTRLIVNIDHLNEKADTISDIISDTISDIMSNFYEPTQIKNYLSSYTFFKNNVNNLYKSCL